MSIPPEWVFTPLNSDRSRTGGDLAAHAFKQSVETFVREVIQNANDQALGRHGAEIVFRLSEYTGEALAAFLDALDWPEFRAHADPVSHEETKGYALRQVLERVHEHDYLLTLSIEDRHTIGLTGEEVEDDSHFCALCRDKLFSHKATKSAGGSYGLGKSVLWTFSGLNTVLFLSRLSEDPATHASPRLIGRTEFPYHRIEGRERSYAGSGWFGERVQDDVYGGERANSVWGEDATAIGARLGLTHDPMTSGTTIMVVGFYDPESDEQMSLEALVERFQHACVENFWPALSRPTRPLQVSVDVDGEELPVTLESNRDVTPLAACYEQRHRAAQDLINPGDVAIRHVPIELPGRHDGADGVKGYGTLLVRWSTGRDSTKHRGEVAMLRGSGMIIQRRDMGRALLGARPFHAVLLCGTARDFEQGKSHDEDVEMFLRLAEPPGHDAWDSTAKLKATYKRGYKKAITTFEGRVREALRQLVLPQPSDGRRAPDRLRRRFPLGAPSDVAPSRGASAFQFRDLTGALSNGVRWDFQGIIAPVADAHDGWEATIELLRVSDDGRAQRDEAIEIEDIHVTTEDVVYELEDGRIHLTAAAHIDEVEFIGWTERITEYVDTSYPIAGEIELRVSGSLREIKS